ncbi:hypothetical protein SERLA73DRAFT_176389 [Serpula lacrymans var. lacrymans S7.3]|uniref:Uncharacterized protein n=1 Tax=Serpula lacrymans var. lacrymans (strain S7.3) TaxID=936435 RepID=F8PMT9_SERL3|nr:hypothetical protein SERLA73DRAFT_176389 [Serpula lacrymans var. lacrymans S7.3]
MKYRSIEMLRLMRVLSIAENWQQPHEASSIKFYDSWHNPTHRSSLGTNNPAGHDDNSTLLLS